MLVEVVDIKQPVCHTVLSLFRVTSLRLQRCVYIKFRPSVYILHCIEHTSKHANWTAVNISTLYLCSGLDEYSLWLYCAVMGLCKIDRCPVPPQLVGDGDLYLLPSVITNSL